VGDVLDARDGADEVTELSPQRFGGVRQPQVHVAVLPEGGEQLDLGDRDPGVAEQREPCRQMDRIGTVTQGGEDVAVAQPGRGCRHGCDQASPQLGLPPEVGGQVASGSVGVAAGLPVLEEARPLDGVRREQARQATGHGVATSPPQLPFLAVLSVTQVQAQCTAPVLARVGVHDLQQRPDQRVGRPGVVLTGAGDLGDQAGRRTELHPGADTVVATLALPEAVGQRLAQPALDAAGRDEHELLREGVLEWCAQQPREAVDEAVRPGGPMKEKWHVRPGGPARDPSGCPRRP
jgi:hypothetical protein